MQRKEISSTVGGIPQAFCSYTPLWEIILCSLPPHGGN